MNVYGIICDLGDGSSSIQWYTDREKVNELLEEEEYYQNEGRPKATLTLPDDADLKAIGIRLSD
jgi:hypothetical protein